MEIPVKRLIEQLRWVTHLNVKIGALVIEGDNLLIIPEGVDYNGTGHVWKPEEVA